MTVFITGGSGFIGQNFINQFSQTNNELIVNIDKLTYYKNKLKPYKKRKYHFYNYDICDYKKIKSLFDYYLPHTIINFAAETHVDNSIKNSKNFINSNIIGVHTLLNLSLRQMEKKSNFLFFQISTDEVFGSLPIKSNKKFSEISPYLPNNPYSASKASAELLIRSYNKTYGMNTIITNCSNNYGPHQHSEKLLPKTINCILNKKKIPIYGDGSNKREWLHVNDHSNALINILKNRKLNFDKICIGSKNLYSNLFIVKKLCQIADKKLKRKKGSSAQLIKFVKDRPGHDLRYSINTDYLRSNYNWKEKLNINKGLEQTFLWYKNNKIWLESLLNKY